MAIRIWDPLELDWTDRMRRWLDVDSEAGRVIRVEEIHDEGMMVVRAEMPGIDPDKDVEISVSDGMLHVLATRHEHTEGREKGTFHSEFRYGEFSRDMVLPSGVDHTQVKASYKDGILEVRIPWADEAKSVSTKVPVSRE